MSSNPSICIPRIESNITKKIITNAFEKFGNVDRIDIVNSGRRSRKAFIHFKRWIPRTDWDGVGYDPSGRAQGVHNNKY